MLLRRVLTVCTLMILSCVIEDSRAEKKNVGYLSNFVKFNNMGGEFSDTWNEFMRGLREKYPEENGIGPGFVIPYWVGEPILVHVELGVSGKMMFMLSAGEKWLRGVILVVTDMTNGNEVGRFYMSDYSEVCISKGRDGKHRTINPKKPLSGLRSYPSINISNTIGNLKTERLYRFSIVGEKDYLEHIEPQPKYIDAPSKYVVLFKPKNVHEEALMLHRIGSRLYLYEKNYDEAERLLLLALQKSPKMPKVLVGLSRIYEKQKRYKEALQMLDVLRDVTEKSATKDKKTLRMMKSIEEKIIRIKRKVISEKQIR